MLADADPGRPPPSSTGEVVADLLQGLLRRTHLSAPSDLAAVVADQAACLGATDVAVYLIDYEQSTLMPLRRGPEDQLSPLSVTGTVAGRSFSTTTILRSTGETAGQRLWLPLLDGTERLGAMGMSFASNELDDGIVTVCERYAHLVAMLIATKSAYGDAFEVARRREEMTIASELSWSLAPPLLFATDGVSIAGMLEPAYDNGGDALDYAVNGRVLHLGVFDAMGHGLAAAGVAAFALSAYRHSRRHGRDLVGTYAAMNHAVGEQFPDSRFVTAVIAQLDLDTGRLSWISAGHPPPVIIRGGRRARTLRAPVAPPLGVGPHEAVPVVAGESLEPGDLLLCYTDGLTEARGPDGSMFQLDGITGFIEREAAAGQIGPETLRRMRNAIIGRERADLRDDATALLVEWKRGAEAKLLPQTVL